MSTNANQNDRQNGWSNDRTELRLRTLFKMVKAQARTIEALRDRIESLQAELDDMRLSDADRIELACAAQQM